MNASHSRCEYDKLCWKRFWCCEPRRGVRQENLQHPDEEIKDEEEAEAEEEIGMEHVDDADDEDK